MPDLSVNLCRHTFQAQTEGDIVKDVQVGKQRVFLKYGVHLTQVRGDIVDPLAVKKDVAGIGGLKTSDHAQRRRLSTAGRTE